MSRSERERRLDRLLGGVSEGVRNELRSAHDDRYLEHRTEEIGRIVALRDRYATTGGPKHVELGANRGAFTEGIAREAAPGEVLGIEWRPKYVRLGNERLAKRGLDNASLLHADAKIAVPLLLEPATVSAIYVLFPDPWWKARHAARRILDPVFLRVLARRLAPGGRLYLKSDVFDYLYRVRACAEVCGALRPLPADLWPDERGWTPSTRERKCMHTAIPFGRGYYQRRAEFDGALPAEVESNDDFPVPDDVDPEAIIRGPAPADRDGWRKRR